MTAKVYSNGVQLKEAELMTLMCPACNGLLRDPVQVTACGDRFCQSCIDRLMRNKYVPVFLSESQINIISFFYSKAPYKCPVDGTEFNANEVWTCGDVRVSSLNTVCLVLCFRFVRTGAASRSSRDWRLSAQLNLPLADGEVIYQTLRYTITAYSLADKY